MTDHVRNDAPHVDDRRESDRIRSMEFSRRLDQLERGQVDLREHVTRVTHGLEMVSHDQANFGKLMDARFAVMEKAQSLSEAKIDSVARDVRGLRDDIVTMASDTTKTPVGRTLEEKIDGVRVEVAAVRDDSESACRVLREEVTDLKSYKDKLDGAFWLLYAGPTAGLGALVWLIVKALANGRLN